MTQAEVNTLVNLQNRGYLLVHDYDGEFPSIVRFIDNPDDKGTYLMADGSGNYTEQEFLKFEDIKVYRQEELI